MSGDIGLVRDEDGVPIDIALGAMPFEEHAVLRASDFELDDRARITTCSATDLIVHKEFAARLRDWDDIRGIVLRSGGDVDWPIVFEELTPLAELKEEPEIISTLQAIRAQAE